MKDIENAIKHLKDRNFLGIHIDMAIESLEKQIPKAFEFDENDLNICPVCKEHILTDNKYCWNCGQRIVLE